MQSQAVGELYYITGLPCFVHTLVVISISFFRDSLFLFNSENGVYERD